MQSRHRVQQQQLLLLPLPLLLLLQETLLLALPQSHQLSSKRCAELLH